jgi:hypothetical protein
MVQVSTIACALLLVACGSSSDPNAATDHGGGSNANGGSGSGGLNAGGSSTAGAAGSGGGASASAGASPSGGAAGGTALSIAPFAKHIACTSDSNDVVLSDGRLYSWGAGTSKGVYYPSNFYPSSYAQVSAGSTDECFLLTDSTVRCADTSSLIGKSTPTGTFTEIHVADGFTSAHAACAKSTAGTLTCWGDPANTVVTQAPTSAVTSFALNSANGCAIGSGGAVQCWGTPVPTATSHTDFANVYTGVLFSCGITATGNMTCWTFTSVATPNIEQLAIGAQFACGIESNGHAFCFDSQTNDPSLVQPPAGMSFVEVTVGESLGNERACGILVDGSVVCWGAAGDGYVRSPPDAIKAL